MHYFTDKARNWSWLSTEKNCQKISKENSKICENSTKFKLKFYLNFVLGKHGNDRCWNEPKKRLVKIKNFHVAHATP